MTPCEWSPEILAALRRIEISTRRAAGLERLQGPFRSVFRGTGMEFRDVRAYAAGDDVRFLDWNVTARTHELHLKQFAEERSGRVFFLVDVSASTEDLGGRGAPREFLAEVLAVLGLSASDAGHRVGAAFFAARVEHFVAPARGRAHVRRVLRDLLALRRPPPGTSLDAGLGCAQALLPRHSLVFLVSDFRDESFAPRLRLAARQHEVLAVHLRDPWRRLFPLGRRVTLRDPESGADREVDLGSAGVRHLLEEEEGEWCRARAQAVREAGADWLELPADRPLVPELLAFFARRGRRRR